MASALFSDGMIKPMQTQLELLKVKLYLKCRLCRKTT